MQVVEAIIQVLEMDTIDLVVMAIVGFEGLKPTLASLKNHKTLALANKESLVIAGDIVSRLALETGTPIIPVDSEHSAIFQCLMGEFDNPIEKIMLTASGGPFRWLFKRTTGRSNCQRSTGTSQLEYGRQGNCRLGHVNEQRPGSHRS